MFDRVKGAQWYLSTNPNLVNHVNFKSIRNWKTGSLAVLAALVLTSSALAQAPKYVSPPPPTKHVALELRLRYLMPPDIAFSGLGAIPFSTLYETPGNLIDGTERAIQYDDGYINQDYIPVDLIEGSTETQFMPSDDADGTSSFYYQNPDQVDRDLDPNTLMFHRYASNLDPTEEFEGSGSGSLGWELNYTKFVNRRRNLGIQVGFSFNGFDSRFNDSIEADLYVQTFKHTMADGVEVPVLEEVVNDDESITYIPYTGAKVHEEDADVDRINWLTSEEMSEQILEGGALIDTRNDLRSSMYNFRAGPTYAVEMGKAFAFQIGAGFSAQYVNGRFSTFEMLSNTNAMEAARRPMVTSEEAEWQVGGYLDASAYYSLTERISMFSGMQVQSGSSYSQNNQERMATVDFSSQVYVHAGMGVKF